ncbi:MoxR family ATPase [Saccharothrix stipae]
MGFESVADEPAELSSGGRGAVPDWWIYRGAGRALTTEERDSKWPQPPTWRRFTGGPDLPVPEFDAVEARRRLGHHMFNSLDYGVLEKINSAVLLARPLVVVGKPGVGKSSLAYSIARELGLGRVLRWGITSRSTVKSGHYEYDAVGRVHAMSLKDKNNDDIGNFVQLGPLGTALLPYRLPRVLLIDEMDKSDVHLVNDLLGSLEEGEFRIPELERFHEPVVVVRTADPGARAPITGGRVVCHAFPLIIITSNGDQDFPPAFLRRCLYVELPEPGVEQLADMVAAHFPDEAEELVAGLAGQFDAVRAEHGGHLAVDLLLNAVHVIRAQAPSALDRHQAEAMVRAIVNRLSVG